MSAMPSRMLRQARSSSVPSLGRNTRKSDDFRSWIRVQFIQNANTDCVDLCEGRLSHTCRRPRVGAAIHARDHSTGQLTMDFLVAGAASI
jgi:hypothetical protein